MRQFTEEEDALLGTDTDKAIALKIGRHEKTVQARRVRLGVTAFQPHQYEWSDEELHLLSTLTVTEVAKALKISRRAVYAEKRRQANDKSKTGS